MRKILIEKWMWIVIGALIVILVGPFLIVWIILQLPFPFNAIATICIIIAWGVAAGYKEWIISKDKEKEFKG